MEKITRWATELKEDVVIMGDYNSTQEEAPAAIWQSRETLRAMDDAVGEWHRNEGTMCRGRRCIDFGLYIYWGYLVL